MNVEITYVATGEPTQKEQQTQNEPAAPVAGVKCFKAVFSAIIYSLGFWLLWAKPK
ncbi:MAG: hypothetical protein ACXWEY_14260 [Bacteroidia bacterium]